MLLVPSVLRGNAVFDALRHTRSAVFQPSPGLAQSTQSVVEGIPTEDRGNECSPLATQIRAPTGERQEKFSCRSESDSTTTRHVFIRWTWRWVFCGPAGGLRVGFSDRDWWTSRWVFRETGGPGVGFWGHHEPLTTAVTYCPISSYKCDSPRRPAAPNLLFQIEDTKEQRKRLLLDRRDSSRSI